HVDIEGTPVASDLELDTQRLANNYDTTFRFIAELGLPLRCGEDPPVSEWVLAGLPWPHAEASWRRLNSGNSQKRRVALLNPFGGAEPLKGFVQQTLGDLTLLV